MIVGIQNYNVIYFKCDIDPIKTDKGNTLSSIIGKSDLKFRILMNGSIYDFQLEDVFFC
jgi:hypothetical protein